MSRARSVRGQRRPSGLITWVVIAGGLVAVKIVTFTIGGLAAVARDEVYLRAGDAGLLLDLTDVGRRRTRHHG